MKQNNKLEVLSFNELVQRRLNHDGGDEEKIRSEIQNQVHDIFTNGMMDGVPKDLFNDYGKIVGLLFGVDQGNGSTSLVALFQEYYGYKLQFFIWSTFYISWFLIGKLLGVEVVEVTRLKLMVYVGFLVLLSGMLYAVFKFVLLPIIAKDMGKYIMKNRKSNELGDINNYYANNKSKPENNFFLAMDGDEIVGHIALDKWIYPGDKVEDAEFIEEYEKYQINPLKMIEIRRMSVKSSYRGGGVATVLLRYVFKYAQELQMNRIILKTSSLQYGARRLYQKLGFEILGVTQYIPPIAIFKFMLDISKK